MTNNAWFKILITEEGEVEFTQSVDGSGSNKFEAQTRAVCTAINDNLMRDGFTVMSECSVAVKTDNTQVLINQDKIIAEPAGLNSSFKESD